jgi:hypothetical protein
MATKTATTAKTPRNRSHLAGKAIGWTYLVGALAVSYTHIVHLANAYGLHGWQAWIAPAFVDGFAILGRLGRSDQYDSKTRRLGFWIQMVATTLSLVANVMAGGSIGGSAFGVLVVAGYIIAELFVDTLRPVQAERQEHAKATRSAAAKKAAATRAANKAKADATKKAATRTAARKARTADIARTVTVPMRPEPSYI